MQTTPPTDAHNLANLKLQLEQALAQHNDGSDGSHDVAHARRVFLNTQSIAALMKVDNERILMASAYLHDLVNPPKNSPLRSQASTLSAEAATPLLKQLHFSENDIAAIQHCIEAHSFSAAIEPRTVEAQIVQDADRLESLGALGIARTFYIAGKLNSQLFHPEDPFAGSRALDDASFAIDHFKSKLLGLASTMQTSAGRHIAEQRTIQMREFLNVLALEIGAEQTW